MAQPHPGRRGSYAKGVAKREEILERALEVVARAGYRGASVKEIADAAALSQAGLLHYFDSKEELFAEVLRKRDEVDRLAYGGSASDFAAMRDGYLGTIRHNADVPGLVELFSRLSVESADPQHPAHRFFLARGAGLRGQLSDAVARAQRAGEVTDRIPPETVARLVQAVADGMQVQWMLEPHVDMSAVVEALFTALAPEGTPE